MNGLERRLDRMFSRGSLIVAAADHGQFAGVPLGLEDIGRYISEIETLDIDGILLNPGVVSRIASFNANKLLIIRVTHAGSALSGDIGNTKYFLDPEQALRLGADAVIVMGIVGQERDSDALHALSKAVWDYQRYGIPVIAEMLPYRKEDYSSPEVIANISRIGAELGANVIKTMMTANYGEVVRSCPVPVIIAGGEKNRDFFVSLEDAAKAGAKGAAIGRNLFQKKDRTGFLKKVREVFASR